MSLVQAAIEQAVKKLEQVPAERPTELIPSAA